MMLAIFVAAAVVFRISQQQIQDQIIISHFIVNANNYFLCMVAWVEFALHVLDVERPQQRLVEWGRVTLLKVRIGKHTVHRWCMVYTCNF